MILFPDGFEWDPRKALANIKRHGVTFDEAATCFLDTNSIVRFDQDHSDDEDRFLLLGMSEQLNLLLVVHVERKERTRIISARPATANESREYAKNLIEKER